MNFPTPLELNPYLSELTGCEVRVKLDGYFPLALGGSKARKAVGIFREAEAAGCDAIVTAGSPLSNHARVMALESARRRWPCVVVCHDDLPSSAGAGSLNARLTRAAGAAVLPAALADVARLMDEVMTRLRSEGRRPYYVRGGGHGLAGSRELVDGAAELSRQCREADWWPDAIVCACGTGGTQAGLVVGARQYLRGSRVVGISVARQKARACAGVLEQVDLLEEEWGDGKLGDYPVEVHDAYLAGGYAGCCPELREFVGEVCRHGGLVCDHVYTGKALWGLVCLARAGAFSSGARLVFWDSGGLGSWTGEEQGDGLPVLQSLSVSR